jgi:hypothetical protein
VDPFTLLAAANTAIGLAKKGIELYKEVKSTAGNVKEVIDDLKEQFAAKPHPPTVEEKRQFNEEVQRVQEVAKKDPTDVISHIGEQLGAFFDAYDAIEQLFWEEESNAKKVYKGDVSLSRRALQRVLVRTRLQQLQAEIREQLVYKVPPELTDLWTRFDKMREQILKEQKEAQAEDLRQMKIAQAKKRRMIAVLKERATWFGAVTFVILWAIYLLVLIRTSHSYRSLY